LEHLKKLGKYVVFMWLKNIRCENSVLSRLYGKKCLNRFGRLTNPRLPFSRQTHYRTDLFFSKGVATLVLYFEI